MQCRTQLRAMLIVAIGALAMLGACSDSGEDLAGPPIPTLGSEASSGGIETVADGSLDAECACEAWSCTIGDCGYDPATDARGACCVENVCGGTPVSKPSCEGGGSGPGEVCTEATPGSCQIAIGSNYCPLGCSCCYYLGGHGP